MMSANQYDGVDESVLMSEALQDVSQDANESPATIAGNQSESATERPTSSVTPPEELTCEVSCLAFPGHSQSAGEGDTYVSGEKRLDHVNDPSVPPIDSQSDHASSMSRHPHKRLREVYGDCNLPSTSRLRTSEVDYDERGLELFTESRLDACTIQESDSDSDSDDTNQPADIYPLFNEPDLSRLTYGMMNRDNRNFERILSLVGVPLSRQEAEDISRAAQRDIISILQYIIECQQQHTAALRHAAEIWRDSNDQLFEENQQLRMLLAGVPDGIHEVRADLQMMVVTLGLMSERMNINQRILMELRDRR